MKLRQEELERCDREIAEARRLLLAGHPDVEGLCMTLTDWNRERDLIEERAKKWSYSTMRNIYTRTLASIRMELGRLYVARDAEIQVLTAVIRARYAVLIRDCEQREAETFRLAKVDCRRRAGERNRALNSR